MTAKKTPAKKTATRNRAAFDSQGKKPRIVPVDIIFDDEKAAAYSEAETILQARERALLESRPRRIAAVRAALPAGTDPEEQARAMAQVQAADDLELDALRSDRDAAKQELVDVTHRYKFRGLGRAAWEAMKERHPATPEDHEAAREATGKKDERANWHFDTLAPELVQAASVSPKLSEEDVKAIFEGEDWNEPEIAALFQAAYMAQVSAAQNPLGRR